MLRLLPLVLFLGCTDPYAAAQEVNTIEAFEQYLTENPSGAYRMQAELKLEQLYLDKARETQSIDDFDAYFKRFTKGQLAEKVMEERRGALWAWAETTDTPEAWQKYMDDYPGGDKKKKEEAKRRMKMAKHKGSIALAPLRQEQINLAENPEGPLDGWGFFVDVTNNGEQAIQTLNLQLTLMDADGKPINRQIYPLVDEILPGRNWAPDEWKAPLKPGETRTWEYTSGDLPPTWGKKAEIKAVSIRFVGETSIYE